ncbi:MAG: hypothetical protein V1722_00230 [Candidatus Micrarchaeota archaeon]
MAIVQLKKPTAAEVKSAVENFARIKMPYHGLLRRDPSFLVGLHNAHRTGNVTDAELLEVGRNFANLFARLPAEKKPAVLQQLDAVFLNAQKHLGAKRYAKAIDTLTSATASQQALALATKSKFYVAMSKLFSGTTQLPKTQLDLSPAKANVDQSIVGLQSTGMTYVGLLRKNPGLIVTLHKAHAEGVIYPAELVALGRQFSSLLRGKSEAQKKKILARMGELFTLTEKVVQKQGPYLAFSHLMEHTADKQAFADFKKSKPRRIVEQTARTNLNRFKETRVGKVLFTELRFPRRK